MNGSVNGERLSRLCHWLQHAQTLLLGVGIGSGEWRWMLLSLVPLALIIALHWVTKP